MYRSGFILLYLGVCFLSVAFFACQDLNEKTDDSAKNQDLLFEALPSSQTGIDFQNTLVESETSNYYQYMYSYIGGGVAAADFNNDGWVDLFFTSNTHPNKLYLNRGELQFEDITEQAGIEQRPGFDAGVTVADVNHDGWVDIYIARGGSDSTEHRFANMLYINQGENGNVGEISFVEQANEYGLADEQRGIQSTFFDYDKDGDLDVYVSNTPDFLDRDAEVVDLQQVAADPKTFALNGSDKLYNNDGSGHFKDVSLQAGIMPDVGFGLNPQVGDLNEDGWLDVYVCNDFRIPDFVYLNNGDGTFREARNEVVKHLSFNSMGSDLGDVNNDGLLDLFTLDMNPEDYVRSKTTMAMTSIDMFETMVAKNYHFNYMHNMLQVNNGNGTFREISKMSGVADTDWSWACLLADLDLDGYNDLYVTNGVYRDVIDRDANNQILQTLRKNQRKPTPKDFLTFTQMLPQQKLTNYLFRNQGDLTFENVSDQWTISSPTFSNGAVYADLDNDGDLEIIVNNINEEAMVLNNLAIEGGEKNYLQFTFDGPPKNPFGIGTQVKLYLKNGDIISRQLVNTRGFLSSVPNRLHVGLGKGMEVSHLEVVWPDDKVQIFPSVPINQTVKLTYAAASKKINPGKNQPLLFQKLASSFTHVDPPFNDYAAQVLLPHKLSQTGPAVAKADVNQDGLEDLYLGGGHKQTGQLLIANRAGGFTARKNSVFEQDQQYEDVGACFFDADKDGDEDLYVVSGSYEFGPNSRPLIDRLYLNDGKGNFTKAAAGQLPEFATAGSVVTAGDVDGDGDLDLFVGGRVIPGQYPLAPTSYLLLNEGGTFAIATQDIAPGLEQVGMVTDAVWDDLDRDEDLDLIVTGEWMGIEVWENEAGKLVKSEVYPELEVATGWWNKLVIADIDEDGDKDILAGNLGLNYKFHASEEKPFHVYMRDFDFNGTADVFLAKEYKGMEVPVRGKTCSSQQLPHLAEKIPSFNDFASRDLEGILGPGVKSALHYEAVEFRSGVFVDKGNGQFVFHPFTLEAQQSPINSILYEDFDGDGIKDLLMAGNNHMSEVETTRADGGIGVFFKGGGKSIFTPISHLESGFFADKDVRNMVNVSTSEGKWVVVLNNNNVHELFAVRPLNSKVP